MSVKKFFYTEEARKDAINSIENEIRLINNISGKELSYIDATLITNHLIILRHLINKELIQGGTDE